MILLSRLKDAIKARWPALRLRSILIGVLLFTALMPGIGAIFLRVYENVLVRQTEAELIAQAAVYDAAFDLAWPGPKPLPVPPPTENDPNDSYRRDDPSAEPYFTPEQLTIDLNTMPILSQRPQPIAASQAPDAEALLAAKAITPLIEQSRRTTLASALILDARGTVLSDGPLQGQSYAFLPEVQSAIAGRSQSVLRRRGDYVPRYAFEVFSRASAIRVHYARPIKLGERTVGVLLLSRSPRALFRGIYDDLGKIALGFGIILAVIIGLAGLLSRAIAKPIEQLTLASAEVGRHLGRGGSEVPPTPATATIEIRALFDNFRRMAVAIDLRSRYLRDFAAAMSHEFKTPLTGIRGVLELLDEHGDTMSAEERRRFIANAEDDAERLSRLVARLLELARADMANESEAVSTPLADPVRRIADAGSDDRFKVEVIIDAGLPTVRIPANVLEAVLTTLVENSRQAGAFRVTISAAVGDDHLDLQVADDGPGIPPHDRSRLFEPFFTTKRANGGTGLGLPIARSLLANSGASIDYVGEGPGACFRLRLQRNGVG